MMMIFEWPLLRCSCYIRYLCLGRCQAVSSWKFRVITYADESGETDSRSGHKVCLLWFIKNEMIVKFGNTVPQSSSAFTYYHTVLCHCLCISLIDYIRVFSRDYQWTIFAIHKDSCSVSPSMSRPDRFIKAYNKRKSGKLRMTAVINNGRAIKIKQQQQQQQKRRHNAKKKLVK